LLNRIESGQGQAGDLEKLLDIADNINGKSFCALGDGAASPIVSSLQHFRAEYEQHLTERRCPFDPGASTVWADGPRATTPKPATEREVHA
jgi:NADH-quinone oxidoreductase subunit F